MTTTDGAGRESASPLVGMRGVSKRFPGVVANEDVTLDLRPGEVHALIGENGAGKSTLMRVLYGLYPPDEGTITVRGRVVKISSPRDALALGIGMVHQHFMLVDPFTVAENITLGDEGGPILHAEDAQERVRTLADSYGFGIDPAAQVEHLSVGEEQRVEILKALYRGVDILILDEPTAVLTPTETNDLFENLRRLRADGKTIVFISHKLDEVLAIADRITVLRRGAVVGETTPGETTKAELAEMMVGRPVLFRLDKPHVQPGDVILRLADLRGDRLQGLSLEVRASEIVGVAGVEGNGQRELADAIMGLQPLDDGRIFLGDRDLAGVSTEQIRDAGIAFVPEDRHEQGLVLDMTLWENAVIGRHDDDEFSGRAGVLFIRKIKELAQRLIAGFDVRTRSIESTARTLSGGNQQKLILARELETDPRLLLAAQPTRGLDVGAIEFVWGQILRQKAEGRGVLLISAELDEIYALSDRIVTLYEGRITGEFTPETPPEELGRAMLGSVAEEPG
ncbi:MAG TPA: ABC transporter ATP-binding protein [Actinomycetota bacterium]|nr:ABC transporter ATP-binding protein [Actinomycetota bacterium]